LPGRFSNLQPQFRVSEPKSIIPGPGAILAIVILALSIGGVTWWLNRPRVDPASVGRVELDVVCLGRVDGLEPVASLEPTVAGKVMEVLVKEGQVVKAKDRLLKLDEESYRLRMEEAQEAVTAAEVEVEAARAELKFQPRRRALQEAAILAAVDRAAAARAVYQERKAAKGFGTITAAELIAAESEAKQLEHLVEAERGRLEELDKIDANLRVRAAEAKKAMAQTALKQAEKAVRDCLLLAPSSGVILRVQTSVGESVMPGGMQAPIVYRPDGPLVIRAELEQEFLGRVAPGMKAVIRDDVRAESPTWTGTVQRLGNWIARKRSILLDPGEMNDVRTVECVILLDGKPEGLLVGQRMRVRIGKKE
jgi:multidrug resistance efflux pump